MEKKLAYYQSNSITEKSHQFMPQAEFPSHDNLEHKRFNN